MGKVTPIEDLKLEGQRVKMTYKDYECTYYLDSGTWTCSALSIETKDITVLKERITKACRAASDLSSVPLLKLSYHDTVEPVTGVSRSGGKRVWCMVPQSGNQPPRREKADVDRLMPDTPKNRATWDDLKAALARRAQADEEIKAVKRRFKMVDEEFFESLANQDAEDEDKPRGW